MKTLKDYITPALYEGGDLSKMLSDLAEDPACLSTKILEPVRYEGFINQELTAFIIGDEILLVLNDQVYDPDYSELADEEEYETDYPMWFSQSSHRLSPVYVLRRAAQIFTAENNPHITLLMITASEIINYDDWLEVTDFGFDTVIFHRYRRPLGMPINPSGGSQHEQEYVRYYDDHVMDYINDYVYRFENDDEDDDEEEDDSGFSDEFDKLLEDFVNSNPRLESSESADSAPDDHNPSVSPTTSNPYATLAQAQREERAPVRMLPVIENPRAEFAKLVGLGEISKMVEDLVALHTYNQRLYRYIKKSHPCSLHSVFSGAVGTGKTTVARIMGSLLHEAGVLSQGHCVLANRGSFVGRWWGTEEARLNEILEKAHGGVLLIDEAYALVSDHPHDPGRNVLPMMLEVLSDEKYRDIAVILCGYGKQMENLLKTNPGLDSRFPNRFEFKEFTFDELVEISRRRLAEFNYRLTPTAWRKYRDTLRQLYDNRGETWGNGREITNRLDQIFKAHSLRCVKQNLYDEDLLTIKSADIPDIVITNKKRPFIGFTPR